MPCVVRRGIALVAVVAACGRLARDGDQHQVTDEPAGTVMGAAGGTVQSADAAATLRIPPGAFTGEIQFNIDPIDAHPPDAVSGVYDIQPDGLGFNPPAVLVIHIKDGVERAPPTGYRYALVNLQGDAIQELEGSAYDAATGEATASLEHLSPYAVLRRSRPCLSGGQICTDDVECCDPFCRSTGSQKVCCIVTGTCGTDAECCPPLLCLLGECMLY